MDREYDIFVDKDNKGIVWATWGDGWKMAAVGLVNSNPLVKGCYVAVEDDNGCSFVDDNYLRSSNCIPSDLRVRSFAGHYDYLRDLSKKMNDENKEEKEEMVTSSAVLKFEDGTIINIPPPNKNEWREVKYEKFDWPPVIVNLIRFPVNHIDGKIIVKEYENRIKSEFVQLVSVTKFERI